MSSGLAPVADTRPDGSASDRDSPDLSTGQLISCNSSSALAAVASMTTGSTSLLMSRNGSRARSRGGDGGGEGHAGAGPVSGGLLKSCLCLGGGSVRYDGYHGQDDFAVMTKQRKETRRGLPKRLSQALSDTSMVRSGHHLLSSPVGASAAGGDGGGAGSRVVNPRKMQPTLQPQKSILKSSSSKKITLDREPALVKVASAQVNATAGGGPTGVGSAEGLDGADCELDTRTTLASPEGPAPGRVQFADEVDAAQRRSGGTAFTSLESTPSASSTGNRSAFAAVIDEEDEDPLRASNAVDGPNGNWEGIDSDGTTCRVTSPSQVGPIVDGDMSQVISPTARALSRAHSDSPTALLTGPTDGNPDRPSLGAAAGWFPQSEAATEGPDGNGGDMAAAQALQPQHSMPRRQLTVSASGRFPAPLENGSEGDGRLSSNGMSSSRRAMTVSTSGMSPSAATAAIANSAAMSGSGGAADNGRLSFVHRMTRSLSSRGRASGSGASNVVSPTGASGPAVGGGLGSAKSAGRNAILPLPSPATPAVSTPGGIGSTDEGALSSPDGAPPVLSAPPLRQVLSLRRREGSEGTTATVTAAATPASAATAIVPEETPSGMTLTAVTEYEIPPSRQDSVLHPPLSSLKSSAPVMPRLRSNRNGAVLGPGWEGLTALTGRLQGMGTAKEDVLTSARQSTAPATGQIRRLTTDGLSTVVAREGNGDDGTAYGDHQETSTRNVAHLSSLRHRTLGPPSVVSIPSFGSGASESRWRAHVEVAAAGRSSCHENDEDGLVESELMDSQVQPAVAAPSLRDSIKQRLSMSMSRRAASNDHQAGELCADGSEGSDEAVSGNPPPIRTQSLKIDIPGDDGESQQSAARYTTEETMMSISPDLRRLVAVSTNGPLSGVDAGVGAQGQRSKTMPYDNSYEEVIAKAAGLLGLPALEASFGSLAASRAATVGDGSRTEYDNDSVYGDRTRGGDGIWDEDEDEEDDEDEDEEEEGEVASGMEIRDEWHELDSWQARRLVANELLRMASSGLQPGVSQECLEAELRGSRVRRTPGASLSMMHETQQPQPLQPQRTVLTDEHRRQLSRRWASERISSTIPTEFDDVSYHPTVPQPQPLPLPVSAGRKSAREDTAVVVGGGEEGSGQRQVGLAPDIALVPPPARTAVAVAGGVVAAGAESGRGGGGPTPPQVPALRSRQSEPQLSSANRPDETETPFTTRFSLTNPSSTTPADPTAGTHSVPNVSLPGSLEQRPRAPTTTTTTPTATTATFSNSTNPPRPGPVPPSGSSSEMDPSSLPPSRFRLTRFYSMGAAQTSGGAADTIAATVHPTPGGGASHSPLLNVGDNGGAVPTAYSHRTTAAAALLDTVQRGAAGAAVVPPGSSVGVLAPPPPQRDSLTCWVQEQQPPNRPGFPGGRRSERSGPGAGAAPWGQLDPLEELDEGREGSGCGEGLPGASLGRGMMGAGKTADSGALGWQGGGGGGCGGVGSSRKLRLDPEPEVLQQWHHRRAVASGDGMGMGMASGGGGVTGARAVRHSVPGHFPLAGK